MILYFSGTGNTQAATLRLAALTGDEAVRFDRCEKADGDVLGLVFPIYGWGMPKVYEAELRKLLPLTRARYIYMVCTCGDDIGTTHHAVADLLAAFGLKLDAAASVQMPETYVALPGFRLDPPRVAREKMARADERLARLALRIRARESFEDVVPGAFSWAKSHILKPLFYALFVGDKAFRSLPSCIGCGICAKRCPVGNISMVGSRPVWQGNCTGCLACYHHCPQTAIQLGRRTRGKGRYVPAPLPPHAD